MNQIRSLIINIGYLKKERREKLQGFACQYKTSKPPNAEQSSQTPFFSSFFLFLFFLIHFFFFSKFFVLDAMHCSQPSNFVLSYSI